MANCWGKRAGRKGARFLAEGEAGGREYRGAEEYSDPCNFSNDSKRKQNDFLANFCNFFGLNFHQHWAQACREVFSPLIFPRQLDLPKMFALHLIRVLFCKSPNPCFFCDEIPAVNFLNTRFKRFSVITRQLY